MAMPETLGSSAQPRRLFRTGDLDAARQHMSDVFRSHDLRLADGPLAMRHDSFAIGRLSIHALRYGGDVVMRAPGMGNFYLFQFALRGACHVSHGVESAIVAPNHSYAVDPGRPLSKRWAADSEQLILRVERDHFENFAQRETGVDSAARLSFAFRPKAIAEGQTGLLRLVQSAWGESDVQTGLGHVRVVRQVETTILSLLLACFPHNLKDEFDRAAEPCAPFYVRRAEQFLRAHARDPLDIDDIVAAAGVSARALFGGFQRFRGTTPMAYLKAIRLDLARRDLAAADPRQTNVIEIATGCGFAHMSRFAQAFKQRFGVTPRQMLGKGTSYIG